MFCWNLYLPPQRPQFEPWRKNQIWIVFSYFGKCFDERLTMEVVITYEFCKLVKIPSFGCKLARVNWDTKDSVGESARNCDWENREWLWQIKQINKYHLDLVFKCLRCANCLNTLPINCLKWKIGIWYPLSTIDDLTKNSSDLQFKV